MKQTETHKKETHIHCLFTSSRFIIPEENPGIYPCIKIFSYGLSTGSRARGVGVGGGGGESLQEICYVPGVFFTFYRARTSKPFARQSLRPFCHS